MMITRNKHLIGALVCLSMAAQSVQAFTFINGNRMPLSDPSLVFLVNLPGASPSGIPWLTAFESAANQWTVATPFKFEVQAGSVDPCQTPSVTGNVHVGASTDFCGKQNLLASGIVAYGNTWSLSGKLVYGAVNYRLWSDREWDIYSGPLRVEPRIEGSSTGRYVPEFGRVSGHEIGHAIGLGHSQFPFSMMASGTIRDQKVEWPREDDICGFSIANNSPQSCKLLLPHSATASGKSTTAIFVGGASRDRGMTYDTVFDRTDKLDVMATVVVEDDHYNQRGRLHVVVELSDGSALMMTDSGFAPWDGSVEALKTTSVKNLSGANELYILKDFDLEANGIANLGVAVFVGYSLESEPGEVYFSGSPISFRIL